MNGYVWSHCSCVAKNCTILKLYVSNDGARKRQIASFGKRDLLHKTCTQISFWKLVSTEIRRGYVAGGFRRSNTTSPLKRSSVRRRRTVEECDQIRLPCCQYVVDWQPVPHTSTNFNVRGQRLTPCPPSNALEKRRVSRYRI